MKNISYRNVDLKGGFLYEKQILNENATIDAVYDRFYDTGRIGAFNFDWVEGMDKQPHVFWDSDVAKWMEGAAYILNKKEDKALEEKVETLIDCIEKNQQADGYFNIFYTVCEPENRFANRLMHELYCAGHLFEAAVAYFEATGKDRFLNLMDKYVDCITNAFVTEKTAKFITPGHQEIELALMRMCRATGNRKHLDLAKFFVDNRGINSDGKDTTNLPAGYDQSHLPAREQTEAVGHCVRACYFYAGMADLAYETDDRELYETCKKLFDDIVNHKMYITGALGSTKFGEAFTIEYDLRNEEAYAETCAAISLAFFAHRMMQFENDARYADIIEKVFYNGMISGLSLDGKSFFYVNPLEINLDNYRRFVMEEHNKDFYTPQRVEVFNCSCCPPNLNRVLASLGDYIYGYEKDTVFVNQFASSSAETDGMKISQTADYPRSGDIKISCENVKKLCIRIPYWCEEYSLNASYTIENGYAVIENPEGEIHLRLEMKPVLMQSHRDVMENSGRVAVCIGPYVCAAESVDNVYNLHSIYIDKDMKAEWVYSDEMCGYTLKVKAYKKLTDNSLYSKYSENFEDYTLNLIPYASFANRGESNMLVWFNVR